MMWPILYDTNVWCVAFGPKEVGSAAAVGA